MKQEWQVALPDLTHLDSSTNDLLHLLRSDDPSAYVQWVQEYYETKVPLAAVQAVYRHEPLTAGLLWALNRVITLDDLINDMEEVGYPIQP